ncbi:MAG: hypothetical protein GXP62_04990, partial [Oligoflexia bacterium]|nr:hypothetical protein [Oligoflexia bacterium]
MSRYWNQPYVSVAERRRRAERQVAKIRKKGTPCDPVRISGRAIATTFWGQAWCRNLEAYSDYANRLPRGRTYARHGSILDLQIARGQIDALVSGTRLYKVCVQIDTLPEADWTSVRAQCAGQIDSLVELLQGKVSSKVMEVVSRHGQGLFPTPRQIHLQCSCPDWAVMCKHIAATLYGVGARLDDQPELLFSLRGVDASDMIEDALDRGAALPGHAQGQELPRQDLSSIFGVDIDFD